MSQTSTIPCGPPTPGDHRHSRTGDTGDAATTTGDTGDAAIRGVCTRWLVGARAWTLPAAWVKTPRLMVKIMMMAVVNIDGDMEIDVGDNDDGDDGD